MGRWVLGPARVWHADVPNARGWLSTRLLSFGKTTIEKLVSLSSGGDKDEALAEYKDSGCWWIEDKPANADLGLTLGLNSILIEHGHNKDYKGNAIVVKKWKENEGKK